MNDNTVIVAYLGQPSLKTVDGVEQMVMPCVGAMGGHMGVGLVFSDGTVSIWGLGSPRFLIQSWRAMKLLERIKVVEKNTLHLCWEAMRYKIYERSQFEALAEQVGGWKRFLKFRSILGRLYPTALQLEQMYEAFQTEEYPIDLDELHWEAERLGFHLSPEVAEAVAGRISFRDREFAYFGT